MKVKTICLALCGYSLWLLSLPELWADAAATTGAPEILQSTNLPDLREGALKKNPGVQAKKKMYEAAKARVVDAWFLEDPEFGVDVEGQSDLFDFGSRMNNEFMVQQTLPFPTKLFLRGFVASKEADIAYQKYREEQRGAIWHIEQPYYELFLARKTLEIYEETKVLLEQLTKSAKARYESGQTPQGDLLKAQIELSKADIEIFNWREKAHLAQAHFSHVLNVPLHTRYSLQPEMERGKFDWTLEGLEKLAIEKRPELRAAVLEADRAGAQRTLTQQNWLPDITLRYEGRQMREEDSIQQHDTFIGVSVPVWSLLKGIGGVWKAAELDARAAESMVAEFKNTALLKVHEAYSKLKWAENALEIYENRILPQAKQQVEVSLASYEAGKEDFLTVIDAQRTFKESQIGYYQSLAEYEMGLSDLRVAVGDDLRGTVRKEKIP